MTNSIPQFVQVDGEQLQPTPEKEPGPVPDTPEAIALARVTAELDKIPRSKQPGDPVLTGQASPGELERDMVQELLPKTIELIQLSSKQHLIITAIQTQCESNHNEIHALKARLTHFESILAGRPQQEADPTTELPVPDILGTGNAAPGFEILPGRDEVQDVPETNLLDLLPADSNPRNFR